MSKVQVGSKVRVLETAFPDSDASEDIFARGKVGTVILDLSEYLDGFEDCYEVELDDVPDGMVSIFPLKASEIEVEEPNARS